MKIKVKDKSNLDKIGKKIKKATIRSNKHAAAYVARVIKNSIRKRRGTIKKFDTMIYDHDVLHPTAIQSVKEYLATHDHTDDLVTGNLKDWKLLDEGERREKKQSSPHQIPYSWMVDDTVRGYNPSWKSYWLRNSIQYYADNDSGRVYSNPAHAANALPIPALLEAGGMTTINNQHLIGYRVITTDYNRGKKHVKFFPVYDKQEKRKRVEARPFMRPGLEKARDKLPEIYAKKH
ncbi:MAG: hypothetical protein LBJ00_04285 [Planctomycetaceae bacterium]|jgi:hypothetical protein|nr:hypothetical protein [Planctomycetaceae bacterium]